MSSEGGRTAAPSGSYRNTSLQQVIYGPGQLTTSLAKAIQELGGTKALIMTGTSLATKTPVIRNVEAQLKEQGLYGATFTEIGQHAPVAGIRKASELMKSSKSDVLIAIGGGSPIDASKAVSFFHKKDTGASTFTPIIAVPTTLSVAETTANAGYTSEEGHKIGVADPHLVPKIIIYDAEVSLHTPMQLWLSTGIRALDHAIETLYRPLDMNLQRYNCLGAIRDLFTYLPACKSDPENLSIRQRLFLAVFQSLCPEPRQGALGLSHGLGHKIGATYGLAHGLCSCLTLARVIKYTAQSPDTPMEQLIALADALQFIPSPFNSSPAPLSAAPGALRLAAPSRQQLGKQGEQVADAVQKLIDEIGCKTTLKSAKIPAEEIETIATRETGPEKKDSKLWKDIVQILQDVA